MKQGNQKKGTTGKNGSRSLALLVGFKVLNNLVVVEQEQS